ncbi:MAG TPA: PAS domain S-box protein, partial [Syntrophorhabdaceae bacterium]|nr:PAS domain S-box protein [Syntrophorhabdaceae bacterium]
DELERAVMDAGAQECLIKDEFNGRMFERIVGYLLHDSERQRNLQSIKLELAENRRRIESAENARREWEIMFRGLAENSASGICITRNAEFRYFNRQFALMHGYTTDELLKMTLYDLIPKRLHSKFSGVIQPHCENTNRFDDIESQTEFVRKDGTSGYGRIHMTGTYYHGEPAVLSTIVDTSLREEADEQLRESEERYRTAVESSNDGIALTKDKTIVHVNQRFLDIFGYNSPDELLGRSVLTVVHPADRPLLKEYREKRERGENTPVRLEHKGIRKDGTEIFVEASLAATFYQGEAVTFVLQRDITDRKKSEAALIESEEQFRSIFENSADAILFAKQDGTILSANPAACRMFGWSEKDLCSVGRNGVVDQSDTRFAEAMLERQKTGSYLKKEYTHIRSDGTRFPAEVSSRTFTDNDGNVKVIIILRDVTERRAHEAAIRENEERFRSIFENSVDAILLIEPGGTILAANPAACKMFGRTEEDICAVGRDGILDNSDEYCREAAKTLSEIGSYSKKELSHLRTDGTRFPAEVSSAVFTDKDGNAKGILILRDITDRRRREEEIQKLNAELEERVQQRTLELMKVNQELRKSESTLRSVFRASTVGILLLTSRREIAWMNERITDISGYTLQELKEKGPEVFLRIKRRIHQNRKPCF